MQKPLQRYENRNKMLNRKLSVEKRKARNHRISLLSPLLHRIGLAALFLPVRRWVLSFLRFRGTMKLSIG